jgi:Ribonuclease J C-terminal domain
MPDSVESLFGGSRRPKKNNYSHTDAGGYNKPANDRAGGRPNNRNPSRNKAPAYNNRGGERLPGHVEDLRALMHEQGVLVVSYVTDKDTHMLLQGVHLESRGLMLPQNGKALHDTIVSQARAFYEIALKDIPDIELRDLNRLLKQDIEKLFRELLDRIPCVIVLIHQL